MEIQPRENCPTCGAPDTFLIAANEWRDLAHEQEERAELWHKIAGEYNAALKEANTLITALLENWGKYPSEVRELMERVNDFQEAQRAKEEGETA